MIKENSLNLLEFPKLLRLIAVFSHGSASARAVLGILPSGSVEEIEKRLVLIEEIRRISNEGSPLRLTHFEDISPLLEKIRPQGAVLESKELSYFIPLFTICSDISAQLSGRVDLPSLRELSAPLTGLPDILSLLLRSIDSEGNILDSASVALSELRAQVRRLEGRIAKKLEEMMRDERISSFLQDNFVTQRSGRWVIPVRMDSKGQVPGVVHDVSRSGETAFIEPLAIISLSNELENLIAEQKAEEIRILRDISSRIRVAADEVDVEFRIVVTLDVLNCISMFADQLDMASPRINDSGILSLVNARHPLLSLAFRKTAAEREVVPLDVAIGGENTVMVITGSNAGGKTIAIKTIGLLQLMALSGMPVPADSSSSFPFIHTVLIDIGDEQSIENSLSTFSAHISNISEILKEAHAKSLVLIDELGTGTDPSEGAALACAVLKEIKARGALLFATTHLTDIKGFVHRSEGMINASMEFDESTLTPLYRLRIGEPGRSHALEIARRYGLPEHVIESARTLLGEIRVEFDTLIADLNAKRAHYESAIEELMIRQREAEEKNRILEQQLNEAERRQKETLAKAYREASGIISATKREMHAFLEEIRRRDREKSRDLMKQVEIKHEEILKKILELNPANLVVLPLETIKTGDTVFVRSLGYDAFVTEVDKRRGRLRVRSGGKEIEVPAADAGPQRGRIKEEKEGAVRIEGAEEVPLRLNLMGMRVDEALSSLEPFLNRASLAGLPEVAIIHGVGTGILAKAVREHLIDHPLVKHFRKGEQSEGGAGVTVVTLA